MDARKPRYKALNYIGFIAIAVDQTQAFRDCGIAVHEHEPMVQLGKR